MNTISAGAATARSLMQVSAQGIVVISFNVIDEPDYYRVGNDDEENGHAEGYHKEKHHKERHHQATRHALLVKDYVELAITSNSKAGYALVIEAGEFGPYRSAQVSLKGYENIFLAAGESARIIIREGGNTRDVKKLKVTLSIPSGAQQGKYPWPINVSALPL